MPHYSPHVGHWGNRFQSLPLSSPSSSPVTQTPPVNVGDAESDASSGREGEQSCNNPTIFVGSLPTNMDEKELRFSLQVHLTQYAKVMYVKIHHGKDGGICAFVQFENVDSAAVFLDTLRANSQRLFLGRRLRFELAHAHRTLLVSYRVPNMQDTVSVSSESHDLPFSMTIRKNASLPVVFNEIASEESTHGVSGLYFQPVICTAEVIHQLATHFGPLERLELYKQAPSDHGVDSERTYPPPHDAPRLPTMDPRCWEIKFQSRSDCVTALNALLTIPFITVTWAHHRAQQSDPLRNAVLGRLHNDDQPSDGIKGDTSPSPSKREESFDWSTDEPSEGHIFSANRLNLEDDESTPRAVIAPLVSSLPQVQGAKNDTPNGVGTSPVSPNDSEFPSTPSNAESLLGFPDWHNNNPRMGCGFEDGFLQREFDRSALYIPNILVHGPEAWTEYKLEDYFSTFGRIKDVKVIRPPNAPTGYAIVSFENIESAAYAKNKQERFGRIQYRHVSRGGRGRGRGGRGVRAYMNNYRRFDGYRRDDRDPSAPPHDFGGVQCVASDALLPNIAALSITADAEPPLDASLNVEVDVHREPRGGCSPGQQKPDSPKKLASTEGEGVDNVTPGALPPFQPSVPTAPSMPTIPGAHPYSMPAPYFHPGPWGVPQMHHMQYGMPYYSGYHMVPQGPAGPHSDANSSPFPTPYWPGMYGPFVSHPTYSQQRDHTDAGQPVYPSPPVPAIGHFQDEHRGLIPYYPQEALSQYMTQHSPDEQASSNSEGGRQPCPSPAQAIPGHAPARHPAPWVHFAPMAPYPYQAFAPQQGRRPWAPPVAGGQRRDAGMNYNKNGRSPLQNRYRGNGNMGESALAGEWNCFSSN
ncbi:hypothetical protein PC9H_003416 [Pleurotus ostreatus]|uniref:RRM domain-containing protein n=2 Tax=Pleurotus TaxID=5320 RepID=A0A8H7DWG2_PLEOS|nr:uncharacterized protein PC9H_003416 [Pleurotus ostreatus]KAF7436583.1 hypothetical protein PC9H_003416 [Pleurotus ostreatus]KAG9222588.1 hypothetical protein CCMSSC00406_0004502 [Pleurotus cornucopiae]